MKRFKIIVGFIFLFTILFYTSCESDDVPVSEETETIIEEIEVKEINLPTVEISNTESPTEIVQEPEVLEDDEEYLRSINNLDISDSITKQEFNDDKTAILKIISELSHIMETKDSKKWLSYIDPESITYYSNPVNLRNAQKKLPTKNLALKNISDYFYYVFIPSRKRSQVDEIRYISKTNIKAVQVREDYSTVVYYYFTKIDGKWLVHLPPV